MSYTVKSSEKTVKSGAEGETKALLYLMNLRADSDEINYFVVDFFNDLTGMDRFATKLWDVQSKAKKNNTPREIGQALVTLFKNFLSEITFKYYILFVGGVTSSLRKDDTLQTFGISNIKEAALKTLTEAFKQEAKDREYIDDSNITDANVDKFLKEVIFVIDTQEPSDYVKAIIKNHPKIIPEEQILNAIFNEIRDKQSSKKNIRNVEGVVIETADQALYYYRHLTSGEIKLLVLQRILNRDPLEKGIPTSFIPIYSSCPPEAQQDLREQCQRDMCMALFDKNAAKSFWALFENIYSLIVQYPNDDVQDIYNKLDRNIATANKNFDALSLKYFISTIKDGIQDDN